MSKREDFEQRTEELLIPILEKYEFELVDVEYVKEAGTWYLRAYIDKPGGLRLTTAKLSAGSFPIFWIRKILSMTAISWR